MRRQRDTCPNGHQRDFWDDEEQVADARLVPKYCRACAITETGADAFQRNRMAGTYQVWKFDPGPDAASPDLGS